jgi:hypothetical protein
MARYFTVRDPLPIIGLGITGPLTQPVSIPFASVLAMLKKGYTVYEHNPVDKSEKVLLTFDNVNSVDFVSTRAQRILKQQRNLEKQQMEKTPKEAFNVNTNSKNKKNNKSSKQNDLKAVTKPDGFE